MYYNKLYRTNNFAFHQYFITYRVLLIDKVHKILRVLLEHADTPVREEGSEVFVQSEHFLRDTEYWDHLLAYHLFNYLFGK